MFDGGCVFLLRRQWISTVLRLVSVLVWPNFWGEPLRCWSDPYAFKVLFFGPWLVWMCLSFVSTFFFFRPILGWTFLPILV